MAQRLTLMALRRNVGERIRDVWHDRKSFLLTKSGKPVARLVPVDDEDVTTIMPDGSIRGQVPLTFRRDLGGYY